MAQRQQYSHLVSLLQGSSAPNLSKEAGENERLTQKSLRGSPEALLKIKGLTRLFLNQNKITEIPKELAQLEKLSAAGA